MLKRESRQRLFTITCHVPRLIRPASVTSQSTRALTCVRLCCFPRRATFPRLPFSFLEDVLHFPTFCSQPTIHSCPSTSDVSIHSLGKATVKFKYVEMHKPNAQYSYELLPSREDASGDPAMRRLALSYSCLSSKLAAMLLTTLFLLIAVTLALS